MLSRATTPRLAVTSLLIAGLVLFAVLVARSSAQSAPTSSAPAAAGSSGAAGVQSGAPIEIPSERVSIPAGDPRQQASRDRAEAARDEKVKKQKTPEAKERRKTAKTKYTNLDSSEALSLARSSFPELLRSEPFEPFHLRGNEKVTKWLGDSAVRVEAGEGEPAKIVESLVPVRVENSSGAMVATDYELEGNADGYRPKTGHARTLLARRVDSGIKLGDIDVTIAPDAAEVGQVEAVKTNDKLFFPGAGRDVDHVVTPLPGGAEFSAILRSEKSPEKLTYRVDLPAGAALVESKARLGGLEIVKGTQTLALISPPVAWDAADTPVPASYAIKGKDRIELRVAHRNEDYEMPIAVDPTITEDQRYWYTNPSIDKIGWGYFNTNAAFLGGSGDGYLGNGLYTYSRGTNYFAAGQYANWQFSAPGNSKITRAEFGYVVHEPQQTGSFPAPYNDDLLAEGIYSPAYNNWEGGSVCEPNGSCAAAPFYTYGGLHYNYRTVLAAGSPGNIAVLQMSMRNTGNHDGFTTYLGSAAIVIDDSIAPIITEKYGLSDSSWTSYREFRARTSDYGLGSKRLVLDSPGNSGWSNAYDYVAPCTGDRRSRCGEWQEVFSSTNGLPEGIQPIRYTGYDVVGNTDSKTWNLRIDRTGPTFDTPTGSLWTTRDQAADHRSEGLYDNNYSVSVTARDGSPGTGAGERSGVREVGFELLRQDGSVAAQSPDPAPQGCASSCAKSRNWSLDTSALQDGQYTVRVTAKDELGYASVKSWTVTVDHVGDLVHGTMYTGDPAAGGDRLREEWFRTGSNDVRAETSDTVVTRSSGTCRAGLPSFLCGSVHSLVDGAVFSSIEGATATDSRLPNVSLLRDPKLLEGMSYSGSGSLQTLLEPWQRRPPTAGNTFYKYTGSEGGVAGTTYVDSSTGLPVRFEVQYNDGTSSVSLVSYDLSRKTASEVVPFFFQVQEPSAPASSSTQSFLGSAAVGQLTDPDTGGQFLAYYLGASAVISADQRMCLQTSDVIESKFDGSDAGSVFEGETADPAGPTVVSNAYYTKRSCDTGNEDPSTNDLLVASAAKASSTAQAWRKFFVETAKAIQADPSDVDSSRGGTMTVVTTAGPATAYVVPLDAQRVGLLLDLPTTTVQILGNFAKADVLALAANLTTH